MFLKYADVVHCMYSTISCSLMNQPHPKRLSDRGKVNERKGCLFMYNLVGQSQQTDKENSLVPKKQIVVIQTENKKLTQEAMHNFHGYSIPPSSSLSFPPFSTCSSVAVLHCLSAGKVLPCCGPFFEEADIAVFKSTHFLFCVFLFGCWLAFRIFSFSLYNHYFVP